MSKFNSQNPSTTNESALLSALADALQSKGTDELRAVLVSNNILQDIDLEEVNDADVAEIINDQGGGDRRLKTDIEGNNANLATSADTTAIENAIGDETTASENADSTVAATVIERLSALVDALTEGQADDQLRVDLTNNNANVATSSDAGAIESAIGDETAASEQADSTVAATVIERLSALVDVLTEGQADDQVRVDLTNNNSNVATSSDVGGVESAIGDETVASENADSTTAATVIERLSALVDALQEGQGDDQIRVDLQNNNANLATSSDVGSVESALGDETTASESADSTVSATVLERLTALVDALQEGQADDQLRVDLESQNAGLAQESTLGNVDTAVGSQSDSSESNTSNNASVIGWLQGIIETLNGTLTVTDNGSFTLSDASGTTATATTSSTGSGNAASIAVPDGRTEVSVGWDTSGSASISVEVSHNGSTWFDRTHDVISSQPSSGEQKAETLGTGFDEVRVYADQNVNTLAVSAKGV